MTKPRSVAATANDNSIPGSRLENESVTQEKFSTDVSFPPGPGSVDTDELADGSVTDAKVSETAAISSEKLNFTPEGVGAVDRDVQSKLRDTVNIRDFGATGDGETDDTEFFQAAISHIISIGGGTIYLPSGDYLITDTLSINAGFFVSVNLRGVSNSNIPTLRFSGEIPLCISIIKSKSMYLENLAINTSGVTGTHIAVLANGYWDSMMKNVAISGPDGNSAPGATATFGLLLRAAYRFNEYDNTAIPFLATYVDPIVAPNPNFNMGVYWNSFERIRVGGYTYGVTLAGREGSRASTNQNTFTACKFNGSYYNLWCDGIGGGNIFMGVTGEGAAGDSVTIQRVSSGSGPVWIGGELSAGGEKWLGPGLILNAVSGTDYPKPNAAGENATHMRFTNQGAQLYGNKLNGNAFISDWNTKVSFQEGSGVTVSKTLDIIEVAGITFQPKTFDVWVRFWDLGSPQGGAALKYTFSAMDVNGTPPVSYLLTKTHDHVDWTNLSGGTVDPILTATVSGTTITITADVNWNGVGSDPGESNVSFQVLNNFGVGTVSVLTS